MEPRDLGLTYNEAAHGIQTAVRHEMNLWEAAKVKEFTDKSLTDLRTEHYYPNGPKHLRVGLNLSKSDMLGLVLLLIKKGIITEEEYLESMRLAANEELARYQDAHPGISFR